MRLRWRAGLGSALRATLPELASANHLMLRPLRSSHSGLLRAALHHALWSAGSALHWALGSTHAGLLRAALHHALWSAGSGLHRALGSTHAALHHALRTTHARLHWPLPRSSHLLAAHAALLHSLLVHLAALLTHLRILQPAIARLLHVATHPSRLAIHLRRAALRFTRLIQPTGAARRRHHARLIGARFDRRHRSIHLPLRPLFARLHVARRLSLPIALRLPLSAQLLPWRRLLIIGRRLVGRLLGRHRDRQTEHHRARHRNDQARGCSLFHAILHSFGVREAANFAAFCSIFPGVHQRQRTGGPPIAA